MTISEEELFDHALAVRKKAYAPYSNFWVGAAIEDENGNIHTGCNVENAAYPNGACAEVGAISAMVSAGGIRISRIAIVGALKDSEEIDICTPCGGCRQRIAEFSDGSTQILLRANDNSVHRYQMSDLLPGSFTLDH